MANKFLEKIAYERSEAGANFHLQAAGKQTPVPKPMTGGLGLSEGAMGSKVNVLSKARQAGFKPTAKPGSVLAMVRSLRGLK